MTSTAETTLGRPPLEFCDDADSAKADVVGLVTQEPKIFGLVLAGGRSQRMQRDKSLLRYRPVTQAQYCFDLLTPFCDQVYISCRVDQFAGTELEKWPQIHDRWDDCGPMGGILSAFENNPSIAWLVVACDLPLLNTATIEYLKAHRDHRALATCFDDGVSGLPEPLCAIYEPQSREVLLKYHQNGRYCPRKVLINEPSCRLTPIEPNSLMNANSPEDFNEALRILQGVFP